MPPYRFPERLLLGIYTSRVSFHFFKTPLFSFNPWSLIPVPNARIWFLNSCQLFHVSLYLIFLIFIYYSTSAPQTNIILAARSGYMAYGNYLRSGNIHFKLSNYGILSIYIKVWKHAAISKRIFEHVTSWKLNFVEKLKNLQSESSGRFYCLNALFLLPVYKQAYCRRICLHFYAVPLNAYIGAVFNVRDYNIL